MVKITKVEFENYEFKVGVSGVKSIMLWNKNQDIKILFKDYFKIFKGIPFVATCISE